MKGTKGEASEVLWPEFVSEDVRQRVENFKAPHGCKVTDRLNQATSLVWFTRVRGFHVKSGDMGWICLADTKCANDRDVHAHSGAMSNWTRHSLEKHNLVSSRMKKMKVTRKDTEDRPSTTKRSNWFKMGKHWFII